MRIAWIGSRGVPALGELGGGIERAVEQLGRTLAARGHEITVYCRSYYTSDAADHEGMRRVVLPTIRQKHLDTIVHTLLATAHALTRGYDIIQYFAVGPGLLSWAPRLSRARSVVSVRALDWRREKWGAAARAVLRLGELASVSCPHATSTVSLEIKQYLERRYGRAVVHIPNGVTPPLFRPPQRLADLGLSPNDYLLFVGRLVPEKGCHDLLRAFAGVNTRKRLVVAGASSYSTAYAAELRSLADPRVVFLGHTPRDLLEELYSHAYLMVLPSYVEGLSNALLEAMAYQRCVLVSDIPENRDVIENYGMTFRRGDVSDLAAGIERLLSEPEAVREVGKRAGEWVLGRYSWERVADATEALYESLLNGRNRN